MIITVPSRRRGATTLLGNTVQRTTVPSRLRAPPRVHRHDEHFDTVRARAGKDRGVTWLSFTPRPAERIGFP